MIFMMATGNHDLAYANSLQFLKIVPSKKKSASQKQWAALGNGD